MCLVSNLILAMKKYKDKKYKGFLDLVFSFSDGHFSKWPP